jgi:hypothetical protein
MLLSKAAKEEGLAGDVVSEGEGCCDVERETMVDGSAR